MTEFPSVLGVDCASRTSAVFSGAREPKGHVFAQLKPQELDRRLSDVAQSTLICWDAPLTGPPNHEEVTNDEYAYSSRLVERFFNRTGESSALRPSCPPKGISTRHYSGMSHWAVTRALIGHPRVGRYDAEPRFELASATPAGDPEPFTDTRVAEVHPAVALWLWLDPGLSWESEGFDYKSTGSRDRVTKLSRRLLDALLQLPAVEDSPALVLGAFSREEIEQGINGAHDNLDAYIAWVLGRLWLATDAVHRLGNDGAGSFLLPRNDTILAAWESATSTRA